MEKMENNEAINNNEPQSENNPEQETVETQESAPVDAVEEVAEDQTAIIEGLNDKLLRAAAEVQNVKRRADIDVQKARHFSIESFAKDLIGVLDNLYRASESVSEEEAVNDEKLKSIKDGVEITKKEMINALERHGIKRIDPTGEKFNHEFHQAMSQIEQEGVESGVVINTMQAGYVIKDRLIRPALVVVAK